MADDAPPTESPDGAAVFPLIPQELGVHPLLLAALHAYVFLEGSDAAVLNPAVGEEALSYLVGYLQRLEGNDLRRMREDMATLAGGDFTMTDTNPLERYSRQMRFPGLGKVGQEKLLASRVTLCGCGALGTVLANTLVRAGVGFVRVIDRDFVEPSNLQRQVLFDESDVANNMPKAEAAAIKLRQINSSVKIEPIVADINRTNIEEFCKDADLILDGSDNFEIRYLINDVAFKFGKPWVYGGAVGSEGMTMTIIPGETPCLRCVFEAAPAPGETGTCETAGVLAPVVSIVASYQATEAIKLLSGNKAAVNRELLVLNIWENTNRRVKVAPLAGRKGKCPCCAQKKFEWLEGAHGTQTTALCGRNAVQVSHRAASKLDFEYLAGVLKQTGTVSFNKFLLKFNLIENGDPYEFTVFPDGRAIIKGTSEPEKARTLYAKYVGH